MILNELEPNKLIYLRNKLGVIEAHQELIEKLISDGSSDADILKKEVFKWVDEVCKWEVYFNETRTRED